MRVFEVKMCINDSQTAAIRHQMQAHGTVGKINQEIQANVPANSPRADPISGDRLQRVLENVIRLNCPGNAQNNIISGG
jgi:hypothetical protein